MSELEPQPVEQTETVIETTETVALPNRPRKVYAGMWGPPEIVVVAAGALALAGMVVLYVLGVVPGSRELARNKSEAERLDAEVLSATSKYGEITDTSTQVNKILGSVDDFETRFLAAQSNGLASLYQRLNGLIRGYGLVNTTGPDYVPLESVDLTKPGQQSEEEKGRSKYRSLYPGVYVTMTVEGPYSNLRRFIREVEQGREFIVISAVELAPSDSEGQAPNDAGAAPVSTGPTDSTRSKGKMHGEMVALHIEMAAYFRRPNFAPMALPEQLQQ